MDERLSFIVAGVQKGGTTALHDRLARQPGLQAATRKELHFFDDEDHDWEAPDYHALHAQFPPANGGVRFEATPVTLYWPQALERARRYNPELKLVVLFRDPVARAYSHWRMERGRGLENEAFAWCIRAGRERVGQAHRIYSYVERGFYAAQLQHAQALFGQERILCLATEDLRRSPGEVVERILDFAEVGRAAIVEEPSAKQEKSPLEAPSAADIDYLRTCYADDLTAFLTLSGLSRSDLSEYPQRS